MINPAELALLAFACYRGTQLVVHDTVLDSARDRVHHWYASKPTSTTRSAISTLIACVYCAGWWIAGALLATWLLVTGQWTGTPLLVHAVQWLAVAGAAVLLSRWDDTRPAGD